MGRFARVLVAAVLCAGAVAGCGGVPDSGDPVAVQNKKLKQGDFPGVSADLVGPRSTGGPMDTMTLLLDAARSTQSQDRLGEAFFTAAAQDAWKRGNADVLLYKVTSSAVPRESETTAVAKFTGTVVGTVSAVGGVYQAQNRPLNFDVNLVRRGGLWLVDGALPGVLVRDSDFGQAFRPVPLYFPTRGGGAGSDDVLVPELRYMDNSAPPASLLTPIVRALIAGPSPSLAPVTRNPLPKNTTLRSNVTLQDLGNDVVVDLSSDVESARPGDLKAFAAQVGWSLRPYFERDVRLEVNGQPLTVSEVDAVQGLEHWGRYNAADGPTQPLYYVSKGALHRLGERENSAEGMPGGEAARGGVLSGAISSDGVGVALVKQAANGKQTLWIGEAEGPMSPTVTGTSITRPTWGYGNGAVLVSVDGVLYRVDQTGTARKVPLQRAGLGPIRALRLASEGVRLALVVGDGTNARAYVGLLQPTDNGPPTLRDLREVRVPIAQVQDIGWSETTPATVMIAGQGADGSALVREVSIDGAVESESTRTGLLPGRLWLATSQRQDTVSFVESGKQLYQGGLRTWSRQPDVVEGRAPFYPG